MDAPDLTPLLSATLLISCPDRKGLVAAVTDFISRHNGNILHLDQHVDAQENVFFMRVEWDLANFQIPREAIAARFEAIATPFEMTWQLHFSDQIPRMAIFVSKEAHCLYDILYRHQSGEWAVDIAVIISNHPDMSDLAAKFGIPYRVVPVSKDTKPEAEAAQLALLEEFKIDFVVLARYMQIISENFVSHYPNRIINIHHSFLPAFAGAKPYHRAHGRGVKIIGASSHYVTAELDAGPIIEQDIMRVNHRDSVEDLVRKGKDVEKLVLSRAVRYHLNHQVLVYNNKTVIFA
ncbi:MAG: formyltetrahydrofolate deformylase [Chloroflexi bacterium]|nr:formyltetrahydrofolate deformylase [Chloroflexota bacterium]MCC6897258.1 formyltetrahydrofolate deformylase [Anaerolineae bacterium]